MLLGCIYTCKLNRDRETRHRPEHGDTGICSIILLVSSVLTLGNLGCPTMWQFYQNNDLMQIKTFESFLYVSSTPSPCVENQVKFYLWYIWIEISALFSLEGVELLIIDTSRSFHYRCKNFHVHILTSYPVYIVLFI